MKNKTINRIYVRGGHLKKIKWGQALKVAFILGDMRLLHREYNVLTHLKIKY